MTREQRRRALLERQARREAAGFYTGRSVADAIQPKRSRILTRQVRKGEPYGRILKRERDGQVLHATKGWRNP